jgi:hypothetical protein
MQTVFGLDFTSAPSKSKPLFLVECQLHGTELSVKQFIKLGSDKSHPFSGLEEWLASEGPWIAGIDLPFGLPLGAVEYHQWLAGDGEQTWEKYVRQLHAQCETMEGFEAKLDCWTKEAKNGDSKRVFIFRYTDRIGSFGGSTPSSPLKVNRQCNPPVGRMFFEGSKRMLVSDISIQPMRPTKSKCVAIEAYPRLVADKFVKGAKYKDPNKKNPASELKPRREQVLDGLGKSNPYGVTVKFLNEQDRQLCIEDDKGDSLDSVLCAVQAAWAHNQNTERKGSFGIPEFSSSCMTQLVALEGWIVDPLLSSKAVWIHRETAAMQTFRTTAFLVKR